MRRLGVIVLLVVTALTVACGTDDERPDAVAAAVDTVLVPHLVDAEGALAALVTAGDALCGSPSEANLAQARDAWRDARAAWRRTEPHGFGPAMRRRSEGLVDWPATTMGVASTLAEGEVSEQDLLGSSAGVRGLGAAEELLFGAGSEALANTAGARCDYLTSAVGLAAAEVAGLAETWTTGSDGDEPYAEALAGRGDGAMPSAEAIEMMVEQQVLLMDQMAGVELGRIVEDSNTPSALVEGPAGTGAVDTAARLEAIRAVWAPRAGEPSLGAELDSVADGAQTRLLERLDAAISAANGIDRPLLGPGGAQALTSSGLFEALEAAEETLSTEVVSAFGVTVGFSDNDGDSG